MIITLLIIRKNVDLDDVPGFKNLTGLMLMIFAVFVLMWGIDRTKIFVIGFVNIPFHFLLLTFLVLLVLVKYGWGRLNTN